MNILKTKKESSERVERIKKSLLGVMPLNLLIDTELHKSFKAKTATQGVKMTDVIVAAIQKYLNESTSR